MHKDHEMQGKLKDLITALGEAPNRNGLVRTPERAWKALKSLTSGYKVDIAKIVNGALFEEKYSNLVIVKTIEFFSSSENPMLPFFAKAHLATSPTAKSSDSPKSPASWMPTPADSKCRSGSQKKWPTP